MISDRAGDFRIEFCRFQMDFREFLYGPDRDAQCQSGFIRRRLFFFFRKGKQGKSRSENCRRGIICGAHCGNGNRFYRTAKRERGIRCGDAAVVFSGQFFRIHAKHGFRFLAVLGGIWIFSRRLKGFSGVRRFPAVCRSAPAWN